MRSVQGTAKQQDVRVEDAANMPLLTREQVGHLRHIRNLASQPDGEWTHMGIMDPGQEWVTAYRYQLASMAYTLGLAHFHRLPAAPGAFRRDFQNLMRKMLRYDVWSYWEHTSRSSTFLDPDIESLREPWRDPVVKENIMYSGHVHAMAGMYGVLFDDDLYEKPGALTMSFRPIFQSGAEEYPYDFGTLNHNLYWQMVESGYLGIPCEPNCVFLVCNQFPILGFRFHDHRKGTKIAEEVTRSYEAAWRQQGWLTESDEFVTFMRVRQNDLIGVSNPWTASVMNAWNRDFVRGLFPMQVEHAFDECEPGILMPRPRPEEADADGRFAAGHPILGLDAMWLSEMGDQERLDALLKYADTFLSPTWEKGGLFYPRNDAVYNEDGRYVHMDPWVGNALIAYARLNVPDGLHQLYQQPWDKDHFSKPNLSDVSANADVLRAAYLDEDDTLLLTLAADNGQEKSAEVDFTIANILSAGRPWVLERDGSEIARGGDDGVKSHNGGRFAWRDGSLSASLIIGGPTDLVLRRLAS